MSNHPRCLYHSSFSGFLQDSEMTVLGLLCNQYHGTVETTSREAWMEEIRIMRELLSTYVHEDGRIIFEYDIPRLGKRLDVVLLFRGIVFCIEFKVGEKHIIEAHVDQVLDYALDLKNFHLYSQDHLIVPILVATEYKGFSTVVQKSDYDREVMNPLITGRLLSQMPEN